MADLVKEMKIVAGHVNCHGKRNGQDEDKRPAFVVFV